MLLFYYYPSTGLISFFAFLLGYILMSLYLGSLVQLQRFRTWIGPESTGTLFMLTGSLMGLTTGGFLAVFESCYYTNRDVKYWVAINNSAVPGV